MLDRLFSTRAMKIVVVCVLFWGYKNSLYDRAAPEKNEKKEQLRYKNWASDCCAAQISAGVPILRGRVGGHVQKDPPPFCILSIQEAEACSQGKEQGLIEENKKEAWSTLGPIRILLFLSSTLKEGLNFFFFLLATHKDMLHTLANPENSEIQGDFPNSRQGPENLHAKKRSRGLLCGSQHNCHIITQKEKKNNCITKKDVTRFNLKGVQMASRWLKATALNRAEQTESSSWNWLRTSSDFFKLIFNYCLVLAKWNRNLEIFENILK